MNTELLTVKEVSSILSCSKSFIYSLCKKNILKPIRIGKKYIRFNKEEIEKLKGK